MSQVILISGRAGSGKDTTANVIKKRLEDKGRRVKITHYADLLKYICKEFAGWNGVKDSAGRHMLQHIGTDIIRDKKNKPDYWVSFVADMIDVFDEYYDVFIIPDCRFENEMSVMKKRGYDVVHIHVFSDASYKMEDNLMKHKSESSMDGVAYDYVICNIRLDPNFHGLDKEVDNFLEVYSNVF